MRTSHLAVSGASGLIGAALVTRLHAGGHRVTRLVRRPAGPGEISWDPAQGRLEPAALAGVDGFVHLAGENVGARWTPERKQRIRSSRVDGTRLVSEAIARVENGPRVLVSVAGIGIYGDRGDEVLTEASPLGNPVGDFLVSVGREWEDAAVPARDAGIRLVQPRLGVVLSREGGALKRMLPFFQLALGGRLGSGSQWLSWVSLDDAIEILLYVLFTEALNGPINATAPEPVTNREFTRTLGRVLGRPTPFPVPEHVLRLLFGEMAQFTLLSSARVLPDRLLESGYRFQHPTLESALRHVLGKERRSTFPE